MHQYCISRNGQSQSRARNLGAQGAVETLKHALTLFGGNPRAVVRDRNDGFAVLSGTSFGLIEQIAFAAAGIAALFLAAEKGSASWEKRNFTGVFVLLMVSYMVNGWAGYLCSALAWPLLLSTEYKRGMAIQRQLQLVGAAEALHLFFLLMAKYGGMAALGFWTNLLWVLLACARGWAALSLYKMQEDA